MTNQWLTRRSPAVLIMAVAATLLRPGAPTATAAGEPGPADALPADPLPSWRDTAPKKAILGFVERATRPGPGFVPEPDRIAVFDNDGTLWAEKPVPFEVAFAIDSVKAKASLHPEWKTQEPFASVLRGGREGLAAAGEKGILKIIEATHSGMTTDDFAKRVETWIATAKHPDTGLPYTSMAYQPMLELLAYLRENGFKTFIVSGGGVEFMRPWVEQVYGIPPWQVVGSSGKVKFDEGGGRPVLVKLPAIELIDDKEGKPIGIQSHIGKRPIAAFGNSDGDLQMLEWATAREGTTFAMLVHHDDARREYAYDRDDPLQKLDKAWTMANRRHWTVVSMKNDWGTIFTTAPAREGAAWNSPPRATGRAAGLLP